MKRPETIKWQKEYEIGIKEVDEQHQRLFALVNKLIEARKELVTQEELEYIIRELIDYTQYHFSTEEMLFKDLLPISKEHRKEHIKFTISIMKYNILFLEGKEHIDSNILFFLVNWLKNHVLKMDMQTFRQLKNIQKEVHHGG